MLTYQPPLRIGDADDKERRQQAGEEGVGAAHGGGHQVLVAEVSLAHAHRVVLDHLHVKGNSLTSLIFTYVCVQV